MVTDSQSSKPLRAQTVHWPIRQPDTVSYVDSIVVVPIDDLFIQSYRILLSNPMEMFKQQTEQEAGYSDFMHTQTDLLSNRALLLQQCTSLSLCFLMCKIRMIIPTS